MQIKSNLCGTVVAFEPLPTSRKKKEKNTGRIQGSYYSGVKVKLANCIEFIRLRKTGLIVTLTSPRNDSFNISEFLKLPRKDGIDYYTWVLEFQKNGNPHYHCVFDTKKIDLHRWTQRWCTVNGFESTNCVRLGAGDKAKGTFTYYIKSNRMAYYFSKYITKASSDERYRGHRTYGVSQSFKNELLSVKYNGDITYGFNNLYNRSFNLITEEAYGIAPSTFPVRDYVWKAAGLHSVYFGRKKKRCTGNAEKKVPQPINN